MWLNGVIHSPKSYKTKLGYDYLNFELSNFNRPRISLLLTQFFYYDSWSLYSCVIVNFMIITIPSNLLDLCSFCLLCHHTRNMHTYVCVYVYTLTVTRRPIFSFTSSSSHTKTIICIIWLSNCKRLSFPLMITRKSWGDREKPKVSKFPFQYHLITSSSSSSNIFQTSKRTEEAKVYNARNKKNTHVIGNEGKEEWWE